MWSDWARRLTGTAALPPAPFARRAVPRCHRKLSRAALIPRIRFRFQHFLNQFHPSIVRLITALGTLLMLFHLIGLSHWITTMSEVEYNPLTGDVSRVDTGWTEKVIEMLPKSNFEKYSYCLFWGISVVSGISREHVIYPQTGVETTVTLVSLICGLCVSLLVFGSAVAAMENYDQIGMKRQIRIEGVDAYLRMKRVPEKIKTLVRTYYEYKWGENASMEVDPLHDLHPKLKTDLILVLFEGLILQSPIFMKCKPETLKSLLSKLKRKVYLPREKVIVKGTIGRALFIIDRGRCIIVETDSVLTRGARCVVCLFVVLCSVCRIVHDHVPASSSSGLSRIALS